MNGAVIGPLVAEARNASVLVPVAAFTVTVWPLGIVLSGWPSPGSGQVKFTPLTVVLWPGLNPSEARADAEKLYPSPSKFAAARSLLSEIPTLLNVESRLPGVVTRIVWFSDWVALLPSVVSLTGAL